MKLSIKDIQTPLHRRAQIYLDGVPQTHVIEADEDRRTLTRYRLNNEGKPYIENGVVPTETVTGEVRIIDPEDKRRNKI